MVDHFGVLHISETPLLHILSKYVCKHIKKFTVIIKQSNFSDIRSHANPNDAYNTFLKIVLTSYEQEFSKAQTQMTNKHITIES